jgi:hypothetical protein
MPGNIAGSSQSPNESAVVAPNLSFEDFLRDKAKEFGIEDRHRRRREWVDAIQRLLYDIRGWLRLSDPTEILDVEQYTVMRTEQGLGTYEAPALNIRLGPSEVNVLPMSREVPFYAIKGASGTPTEFAGRVDITGGLRKLNILRENPNGEEKWQIRDERNQFTYLDRERFLRLLQDLLS